MNLDSVVSNTFQHDPVGSWNARDVLFLGLVLLLEESPAATDWIIEELRRERTHFDTCREIARKNYEAEHPRRDPDAGLTPEQLVVRKRQKAEADAADERRERQEKIREAMKNRRFDPREGEPPPRVYTAEEDAAHEERMRRKAELNAKYHQGTEQLAFHSYDAPVSAEELASHSLESYLVRGFQLVLMSQRPKDITAQSWGPMSPEDVERLVTAFAKIKREKQRALVTDQRMHKFGDETAIVYVMFTHRVDFFGLDPYNRFPERTPQVFSERCTEKRFSVLEGPTYFASVTREVVLRRWVELIGTPFDAYSAPAGAIVLDTEYPAAMKQSVAEGFMPGDMCRKHYSALEDEDGGYTLPPLSKK